MTPAEIIDIDTKRATTDFELVWKKMIEMSFESLKEAHRYSYLAGRSSQRFQDRGNRLLEMAGKLDSCGAEEQSGSCSKELSAVSGQLRKDS